MDDIKIPATQKTPLIQFSASGNLELRGRSIPENSLEFYKPLMDWLDKYVESTSGETTVHVQLEYFNTSSSKCLLDLFKRLENLSKATINWYYEQDDEDMLEAGEDYEAIVSVPFKMIEIAAK